MLEECGRILAARLADLFRDRRPLPLGAVGEAWPYRWPRRRCGAEAPDPSAHRCSERPCDGAGGSSLPARTSSSSDSSIRLACDAGESRRHVLTISSSMRRSDQTYRGPFSSPCCLREGRWRDGIATATQGLELPSDREAADSGIRHESREDVERELHFESPLKRVRRSRPTDIGDERVPMMRGKMKIRRAESQAP